MRNSCRIILIYTLLTSSIYLNAAENKRNEVDSVTYQLFINGKWEELIRIGKEAIQHDIDFKTLRQRLGFAYYSKGDYISSRKQYEHAFGFDKKDLITIVYLYYNGLFLGDFQYARYYARLLPKESQDYNRIKKTNWLTSFDIEYSFRTGFEDREPAHYYRIGFNSQPGFRWNIYQAFSKFDQQISTYDIVQKEYFISGSYSITAKLGILGSYHYLESRSDSVNYPGHVFLTDLYYRLNRFSFGLTGSYLTNELNNQTQFSVYTNILLPFKFPVTLKSSLYYAQSSNYKNLILSETVNFMPLKKTWIEANITLGNLKNYVTSSGLYVYNSMDSTIFRFGASIYQTVGRKITIYTNYTFDQKKIEDTNTNYYQHAISGGLIWQL